MLGDKDMDKPEEVMTSLARGGQGWLSEKEPCELGLKG